MELKGIKTPCINLSINEPRTLSINASSPHLIVELFQRQ